MADAATPGQGAPSAVADDGPKRTPLAAAHAALGARMVPFAGWSMPVQYEGVMAEHAHTRAHAGLFDISHMGQVFLAGPDHGVLAEALERLVPADVAGLAPGRGRYTVLTTEDGGILDDLIITRLGEEGGRSRLFLVVNAARRDVDIPHLADRLPDTVDMRVADERALLALQGPEAEAVLAAHAPAVRDLAFMEAVETAIDGIDALVTRSGYTGEDGFEISVPAAAAEAVWNLLLADGRVKPVGLGARDSLRLEAGLCLYGSDLDETTSPVEAGLAWSIPKRRREAGGFPGAARVHEELADGPARRRVGIRPTGRAPARAGTEIRSAGGHEPIGTVTSGGFGPSVGGPVAMGYVAASHAAPGTAVELVVRGKAMPAEIVKLPFVPQRQKR